LLPQHLHIPTTASKHATASIPATVNIHTTAYILLQHLYQFHIPAI
jgi:hypothetical protein